MTKEEAAQSSPDKRSGALMQLGYLGVEHGFTDEQIYVMLEDADRRWDKYVRRSKAGRHKILLDTIARARAKLGYMTEEAFTFSGLVQTQEPTNAVQTVFNWTSFLSYEANLTWLIEGFLPEGGFGVITGDPGVGKTQLALQTGIELARGAETLLKWPIEGGPRKVLFLSLEMPIVPLQSFISKMSRQYVKDSLSLERNFYIAPVGYHVPLNTLPGRQWLEALLSEYKPDLLIVDSLQRAINKPMTDEVAIKELAEYISRVRQLYSCGALFIHHNRKRQKDSRSTGDLSEMFGSQMLAAELDMAVNLRAITGTQVLSVDCWKNRLAQEWPTFEIQRNRNLQYELYSGQGAVYIGPDAGESPTEFRLSI